MPRGSLIRRILVTVLFVVSVPAPAFQAQQVIDRVVARVEGDVILQSDLDLLARYQQLVDGEAKSDAENLDHLIDQWIVRSEAAIARTPVPSDADVQRGLERLQQTFASKEDYEARRKLSGLSEGELRRITADQVYLNNYLDSRFRPTVQVDEMAIQSFYETALVPRAKARGQNPPPLEAAHDSIQEALVQQGIDEQADRWLKESHARLHVTKLLQEGRP
jgi:hypothetical protein